MNGKEPSVCDHATQSSSVSQTLDELEFERGIWQASIDNDLNRVRMLLDKGCSVNARDPSGYTALHYASRAGHIKMVELLLSNKADPNPQTLSGKDCPLHRAAYQGNDKIVLLLLENGADPFLQNIDGQTALHKSTVMRRTIVSRILLDFAPELKYIKDNKEKIASDYDNA